MNVSTLKICLSCKEKPSVCRINTTRGPDCAWNQQEDMPGTVQPLNSEPSLPPAPLSSGSSTPASMSIAASCKHVQGEMNVNAAAVSLRSAQFRIIDTSHHT